MDLARSNGYFAPMKNDKDGKPTQFGSISSPGGAIFVLKAGDDTKQLHVEVAKAILDREGIPFTKEVLEVVEQFAIQTDRAIRSEIAARGVPAIFRELFAARKKKVAKRFAADIVINLKDFSDLSYNVSQIGFRHRRHHEQYVPKELRTTEEERIAFFSNGLGSLKSKSAAGFFRKTLAIFSQRKNVNAHLFEKENEWHIFWFTFDDVFAGAKGVAPHWTGGDHIHYTSHLWGHNKDEVWQQLVSGRYSISGIHIKYHDERNDGKSHRRD